MEKLEERGKSRRDPTRNKWENKKKNLKVEEPGRACLINLSWCRLTQVNFLQHSLAAQEQRNLMVGWIIPDASSKAGGADKPGGEVAGGR